MPLKDSLPGVPTYKVYIGLSGATTVENITDIQATSNEVTAQRAPWGVNLTGSAYPYPDEYIVNGQKLYGVTLSSLANQNVAESYGYAYYFVDAINNELLYSTVGYPSNYGIRPAEYTYTTTNPSSYKVYIAAYGATTFSEITDIQAISGSLWPDISTGIIKDKEVVGGQNPSTDNCNQQCYGDPVNTVNGEFFDSKTDISLNAAAPFDFTRSYSSTRSLEDSSMGYGWKHNYDMHMYSVEESPSSDLIASKKIAIAQENGSEIYFYKADDGTYVSATRVLANLMYDNATQKFILTRYTGKSFIFDSTGTLLSITDKNGNTQTLSYNETGLLDKIDNGKGQSLTLFYNTDRKIIALVDSQGRTINYTYNIDGTLKNASALQSTNKHEYLYDSQKRIISFQTLLGGTFTNTYNSAGKVTRQVDPMGNTLSFNYYSSNQGQVVTITKEDGTSSQEIYNYNYQLISTISALGTSQQSATSIEYNAAGQQSKVTDALGNPTYYEYDSAGNVANITDAQGNQTSYIYNALKLPITTTDAAGNVTSFTYDNKGNLLETISPTGSVTRKTYNENGTTATAQSPNNVAAGNNIVRTLQYSNNGFLASTTDEVGVTVSWEVNELGSAASATDPEGNRIDYIYDGKYRLIRTEYENGSSEETTYDASTGLATSVKGADGNTTSYTYDKLGHITTTTSALGITTYTYNDIYQLIQIEDYAGRIASFTYDSLGNAISSTDPMGNTTTYAYDISGRKISSTTAKGETTTYAYNSLNQVVSNTDSLNQVTSFTYDAVGNALTFTNPNSITTTYGYDADGRVIKEQYNDGTFIAQTYDANGNIIQTIDEESQITSHIYDAAGRLTSSTDPTSQIKSYAYNSLGTLNSVTYPDGTIENQDYDSMGNIKKSTLNNAEVTVESSFTYDMAGRPLTATKQNSTTTYNYDSLGNLTYRGPPSGQGAGVQYSYNNVNQLSQIVYPDSTVVTYAYNLNGSIESTSINGSELVTNTFDANNAIIESNYANGLTESHDYTSTGLESKYSLLDSQDEELYAQVNTYGLSGLLIASSINESAINFTKTSAYDSRERIASQINQDLATTQDSITKSYVFDPTSNLTTGINSSANTYNPLDQLMQSEIANSVSAYTYDARGNRLTEQQTAPEATSTRSLQWSLDNNLNSVIDGDTTYDYQYETEGLLSAKQTTQGVNSTTESFTWDTVSSIPAMLSDGKFNYIYNIDNTPFAQIDKLTGDINYLFNDSAGSIIFATDVNGNKLASYVYDAYGNLETGSLDPNHMVTKFGYTGEYRDNDTGYIYLRARWYDPATASFLSLDPALSISKSAYAYASGNPLSYSDPMGLWSMSNLGKFFSESSTSSGTHNVTIDSSAKASATACSADSIGLCGSAIVPMATSGTKAVVSASNYMLSKGCGVLNGIANVWNNPSIIMNNAMKILTNPEHLEDMSSILTAAALILTLFCTACSVAVTVLTILSVAASVAATWLYANRREYFKAGISATGAIMGFGSIAFKGVGRAIKSVSHNGIRSTGKGARNLANTIETSNTFAWLPSYSIWTIYDKTR